MSMLRRAACMKWLPPIANRSPSPEYTTTCSSGLESLSPVANGMARPWGVWKLSRLAYPATRPVQPMPETIATLSRFSFELSSARAKQFTVVPMPQAGHHMCGMRSMRRKGSTGLVAVIAGSNAQSIMASLIEQRAAQDLEAEQHRARSSPDGFTTPSGRPELKPPALAPRQRIVRPDALRMPYDKDEARHEQTRIHRPGTGAPSPAGPRQAAGILAVSG